MINETHNAVGLLSEDVMEINNLRSLLKIKLDLCSSALPDAYHAASVVESAVLFAAAAAGEKTDRYLAWFDFARDGSEAPVEAAFFRLQEFVRQNGLTDDIWFGLSADAYRVAWFDLTGILLCGSTNKGWDRDVEVNLEFL